MSGMQLSVTKFTRTASAAVATLFLGLSAVPVQAADYFATSPAVNTDASVCSQQSVLKRVVSGFAYQVKHVPDMPMTAISSMGDIRLKRFEAKINPSQVARTYCDATAVMTDGQQRKVWYLIEERQGFVTLGSNVEFCVDGYDKWYVYNASCSVLKARGL
ncbi:phage portal protein [Paenochrobactrum sp. BZR 588]|uniref:phage portal protein n=1 Tax=unclassified Paenochrobactrum TaxID=2639760 RepID=UPI003854DB51